MLFLRRHWVGDYSLPVSFFCVSLGCFVACGLYLRVVVGTLLARWWRGAPLAVLVLCTLSLALVAVVAIWQYVGTLQAVRRYRAVSTADLRRQLRAQLAGTGATVMLVPIGAGLKALLPFGIAAGLALF